MIVVDKILVENVKKLRQHRYFDDSTDANKQIYNKTLLVLATAYKNNCSEALLLMDNKTYNYRITCQGNPTAVSFNEEMIKALINTNNINTFTAIHNHPTDTRFSLGDLNQLLLYRKLNTLVLITNSCKYSALLYKTNKMNSSIQAKIISKIIDISIKINNDNIHKDPYKIIEFLQKLGLVYMEYINY